MPQVKYPTQVQSKTHIPFAPFGCWKKSKNITKPEKSRTKLQPSISYMTLQILIYFPKGTFLNKTKENQSKQQLGTCHLQKFKTINKLSTHLSTKKTHWANNIYIINKHVSTHDIIHAKKIENIYKEKEKKIMTVASKRWSVVAATEIEVEAVPTGNNKRGFFVLF